MKIVELSEVLALGARAFVDLQIAKLGTKITVLGALHAPFRTWTDACEEFNKRFYFMGRDAQYTIDDCVSVLRGEPSQQPDDDWISANEFTVADPTLGHATRWNGTTYATPAEYQSAARDYQEKRLAEIEATLPEVRKLESFQTLRKQYPTLTDLEVETLRLVYDRGLTNPANGTV